MSFTVRNAETLAEVFLLLESHWQLQQWLNKHTSTSLGITVLDRDWPANDHCTSRQGQRHRTQLDVSSSSDACPVRMPRSWHHGRVVYSNRIPVLVSALIKRCRRSAFSSLPYPSSRSSFSSPSRRNFRAARHSPQAPHMHWTSIRAA